MALTLTLALNWYSILTGVTVLVFVGVSVLMILTVLIQRPAGGGLSGAFGSGAGSGQTAFGTKTGDALTIATITMFVLFLLFAIVLNFLARPTATIAGAPAAAQAPVGGAGEGATAPAEPDRDVSLPATAGTTPATTGEPPAAPASGEQPASTPPPAASPPASDPPASPAQPPPGP